MYGTIWPSNVRARRSQSKESRAYTFIKVSYYSYYNFPLSVNYSHLWEFTKYGDNRHCLQRFPNIALSVCTCGFSDRASVTESKVTVY